MKIKSSKAIKKPNAQGTRLPCICERKEENKTALRGADHGGVTSLVCSSVRTAERSARLPGRLECQCAVRSASDTVASRRTMLPLAFIFDAVSAR